MLKGLKAFLSDTVLLKRYAAVIIGLVVFRLIASVPVPQIDQSTISALLHQNQILGAFNIFSGGGLSNFSIAMLGVFPYITVSIVVQLLTSVSTKIHSLYHEEGEIGRKKNRAVDSDYYRASSDGKCGGHSLLLANTGGSYKSHRP